MKANYINTLYHLNATPLIKQKLCGVWAGVFSLSLSLSLSLSRYSHLWHAFALNLKGFFTHFVVVSSHFIADFSYFIVVLTHLFACKRHFVGHYAFLKFLNTLFLGFLRLSLRAVFWKTAWQSINLALPLPCSLPRKTKPYAPKNTPKF